MLVDEGALAVNLVCMYETALQINSVELDERGQGNTNRFI